jgi:Na+-driven multidrug efflux pump
MLMRIFTNDLELISYGAEYQRVISFSYLAAGISQMYLAVIKSMEQARFSALASSAGLLLNILLNALSIFVLFPGRIRMAIAGVAVATVISRVAELVICVAHSFGRKGVKLSVPQRDDAQKLLLRDFWRYTAPVQGNYIVWGGAMAAMAAIIGHVSSDMVAAHSVASSIKSLAIVLCHGLAFGGSILVGKYLGMGDAQKAKKAGIRLYLYSLIFGALAGITILLARPIIYSAVELNENAHGILTGMLIIHSYYCIGESANTMAISGIFPAGGDTKFGFLCDATVMWCIMIPTALICAFLLLLPPVTLYFIICLDEFVKLPAAAIHFRKYMWVTNITRNFALRHEE